LGLLLERPSYGDPKVWFLFLEAKANFEPSWGFLVSFSLEGNMRVYISHGDSFSVSLWREI